MIGEPAGQSPAGCFPRHEDEYRWLAMSCGGS